MAAGQKDRHNKKDRNQKLAQNIKRLLKREYSSDIDSVIVVGEKIQDTQ